MTGKTGENNNSGNTEDDRTSEFLPVMISLDFNNCTIVFCDNYHHKILNDPGIESFDEIEKKDISEDNKNDPDGEHSDEEADKDSDSKNDKSSDENEKNTFDDSNEDQKNEELQNAMIDSGAGECINEEQDHKAVINISLKQRLDLANKKAKTSAKL